MIKKSNLDRLARELRLWLPVVFWLLRIANEVLEIVSKAVNYARQIRELYPLFQTTRKAGIRAI